MDFPKKSLKELFELDAKGHLHGIYRVSSEDYHAGPGISSSQVKQALISPAHLQQEVKDTPAMKFGRMVHSFLLEPDKFHETYRIMPTFAGKGSVAAREAWKADIGTAETLEDEDLIQLNGMKMRLQTKDTWKMLQHDPMTEFSVYSVDPITGLTVKCRPDLVCGRYMADLKTTQSAHHDDFPKDIINYGYHISAAFYLFVLAQHGLSYTPLWVALEKKKPWAAAFFSCPDSLLEAGVRAYRSGLTIINACHQSGEYPDYCDAIQEFEVKPWMI